MGEQPMMMGGPGAGLMSPGMGVTDDSMMMAGGMGGGMMMQDPGNQMMPNTQGFQDYRPDTAAAIAAVQQQSMGMGMQGGGMMGMPPQGG